jgi:hypothetical protein
MKIKKIYIFFKERFLLFLWKETDLFNKKKTLHVSHNFKY